MKLVDEITRARVQRIYLHIDAGKDDRLRQKQQELCSQLKNQFGNVVKIKVTKENLGVARSVYTAIEWFFSNENSGVILEDDLVVSSNTFDFFQETLPIIASYPKCLLISGSTFLKEDTVTERNEIRWTNFPLIWGWGTTAEKWETLKELMIKPVPRKWFVSRTRGFLSIGAYGALTGSVDTWDSPIALGMWINKYLCMIPPYNSITNIGADLTAVHTKAEEFPIGNPIRFFDASKLNFIEPSRGEIEHTNKLIIRQNYKLKGHHIAAPLYLRLKKADQTSLQRKLIDVDE